MKKALALITALGLAASLSVSAMAAELTEDRNTHGEWVGTYGKDGYIIFNPAFEEHVTRETLPEYVTEFTYTDLYEGEAPRHSWWSGTAEDAAKSPKFTAVPRYSKTLSGLTKPRPPVPQTLSTTAMA